MRRLAVLSLPAIAVLMAVAPGIVPTAQETTSLNADLEVAQAVSNEVTLKGIMMWEISCVLKPQNEDDRTVVLFAVEGTPEVAREVESIMKENWPGESMNGYQARNLNRAFEERLKYYLTPGQITTDNEANSRWRNPMMAVTGVVSERDGKKWITPSSVEPTRLEYPDKMLAPDKPLKTPTGETLTLKVTDTVSLKCILLPRGEFLMAKPYYIDPRWQDEFPRHITLTKPFYLAEIPVTQEMFEAVLGKNPSTVKDPQRPVRNVPCADVNEFCRILSEKNGRTIRLPGEAEWEYAARVGTSNPPLDAKYADQESDAPGPGKQLLPVKSREPNAWGLYDMISNVFEMTRDRFIVGQRNDAVDPYDSCEEDEAAGRKHSHWGRNRVTYHEAVPSDGAKDDEQYATTKFRVLVEATPEEIAEMEKAETE